MKKGFNTYREMHSDRPPEQRLQHQKNHLNPDQLIVEAMVSEPGYRLPASFADGVIEQVPSVNPSFSWFALVGLPAIALAFFGSVIYVVPTLVSGTPDVFSIAAGLIQNLPAEGVKIMWVAGLAFIFMLILEKSVLSSRSINLLGSA